MSHRKTRRRFLGEAAAAIAALHQPLLAGAAMTRTEHQAFICVTCGTQFSPSEQPPTHCPICEDPRQYVGWDGQQWTTLTQMQGHYRNTIREEEPGLHSIHTDPRFGIGERSFLVKSDRGNILWDCVSLLDEPTMKRVKELGGIAGIAISHPHYYATMVEWSRAFGDAPIYLHEADRRWVMRPDERIVHWKGETRQLPGGLTLINSGGHFDGFQVLHWPAGAAGRGVLLAGDQPQVCMDRRWTTFMYSYPNDIPLSATAIRRVVRCLEPFPFDRLYGAFVGRTIPQDAKGAVARSAERYLQAIRG